MALTDEQKKYILQGGVLNTGDPQTQRDYADFVRANLAGGTSVTQPITMDTLNNPSIPYVGPNPTPSSPITIPTTPPAPLSSVQLQESDINTRLQKINDLIAGKPAFETQQRQASGIEQKISTQQSIYNQLLSLKAQTENIPNVLQMQSEGRGITNAGLAPQQAGALRLAGIQANILNAQYAAASGDLANAERLVQQAVSDKFGPEEAKRDALIANLKLFQSSPQATNEEKQRAATLLVQTAADKTKTEKAKKAVEDILKLANDVGSSQIQDNKNALIMKQITDLVKGDKALTANSDLYAQALQIAQPYLAKKETIAAGTGTVDMAGLPNQFVNAVNQGKTGEDIINSLTPIDKATLESILNYEKNPANLSLRKLKGEASSEREKFLSMAHLIDPNYDESQYATRSALKKDFNSGKSAQNIRSLNTAVGHLDTLSKAGVKLENSSLPLWNKIANAGLNAIGDPRVVAFNTAANAVEGELAGVFKGMGATDQEITVWRQNINSSQSPEQLRGAINTAIELMGSRLQALTNQYELGIGKPKDFKILSDKSRQILTKLGVDVNALDPIKTPIQTTAGASGNSYESYLKSIGQ